MKDSNGLPVFPLMDLGFQFKLPELFPENSFGKNSGPLHQTSTES